MKKINFWLERPPFATAGFLKPLKKLLGNSMNIYIRDDYVSNRKGFDEGTLNELGCILVHKNLSNVDFHTIADDSINVINGFNSFVYNFLKEEKQKNSRVIVGCYTELPHPMGHFRNAKKILLKFKYRKVISRASNFIDFLLPIGQIADDYYKLIGWHKPSLPFFYITDLVYSQCESNFLDLENGSYCYIGRNDFVNKGLNKLLKFFKRNQKLNLLIIGNYGVDSEKVMHSIQKFKNIKLVPSIDPCDIIDYLRSIKIKCIVVPSNIDGWNPNVYLSLLTGVPCIATNASGSFDLIEKYDIGFVCRPSYRCISKTILKFENLDCQKKTQFFTNAHKASLECSPENIAKSLLRFLESTFEDK